ncbi:MAG: undecaprenyl-diphosphate phosphatase [Candidatus Muirbacterium halophilum]|nr:undecaprenyl-diphosphate phosphatase [Candidatus Muirbacterium halophilum]MCK9474339.1 undecaprenyl-diphosphate phosphatase [Candidatus Muirbacterium halophilum]
MIDSLAIIILGLIQGLTEFLPVSSSGHLVFMEYFLNFKQPGVFFDVLLHFGTAFSVVFVFYKRIIELLKSFFTWKKDNDFYLCIYIIIANIPVAIIGLGGFDKYFKALFSINIVAFTLILNGVMMYLTKFIKIGNKDFNIKKSIFVGIAQCIAITPGISRSGSTIFAALLGKISPIKAFEFSFLLSLPVIFGAAFKEFFEVKDTIQFNPWYLAGFLISFITGIFALKFLKRFVVKGKLHYFGIYCFIIGCILILVKK